MEHYKEMLKRFRNYVINNKIALIILILSLILHNIGLDRFPAYYFDEFFYVSRGYEFHQFLSFKDYNHIIFYDHPPLGWILFGLFSFLFPNLAWSFRARIFISVLFFFEQYVLYGISKKYYNKLAGNISILIHSVLSLSIFMKRQFFLDNIGIIFVLLSFYYFYSIKRKKKHKIEKKKKKDQIEKNKNELDKYKYFYLSAFIFGCSIMIKFPMVLFLPGFIIFYFYKINKKKENFTKGMMFYHLKKIIFWMLCAILPLIFYTIILGITGGFIKFAQGILWQMGRNITFDQIFSTIDYWLSNMPLFYILVSLISIIAIFQGVIKVMTFLINILKSRNNANTKLSNNESLQNYKSEFFNEINSLSLFIFVFILFLLRGGVILIHYIIPLIPFGCLLIGVATSKLWNIFVIKMKEFRENAIIQNDTRSINPEDNPLIDIKKIERRKLIIAYTIISLWLGIIIIPYNNLPQFENETEIQYEALEWVIANLPLESNIIVYNFFVAELRDAGFNYVEHVWFINEEDMILIDHQLNYMISPNILSIEDIIGDKIIIDIVLIKQFNSQPDQNINIFSIIYED